MVHRNTNEPLTLFKCFTFTQTADDILLMLNKSCSPASAPSWPINARAYPSCRCMRGGVHPGQSITGAHSDKRDKQPCTLTLTPRDSF